MAKKQPITQDLVDMVENLKSQNTSDFLIKRAISTKTGWKKTKSLDAFNEIIDLLVNDKKTVLGSSKEEEKWEKQLVTEAPYVFNPTNKTYVVFLKRAAKNIVVKEETHKAILEAYSDWDGDKRSLNDICRAYQFPRPLLEEYLKIFGITHDSLPITKEDFDSKSSEDLVQDLQQKKQWALIQKYNKQDWNITKKNADRWVEFKLKNLDPYTNILKTWKPPKMPKLPKALNKPKGDNIFVCGAFDWQIGMDAKKRYLFNKGDWSTKQAEEAIVNWGAAIIHDIKTHKLDFKKCVLILGGDLHHGFRGITEKGTPLECDTLRDDQFDAIFNSLIQLITTLYQVFGKIEIRAVRGNHDGFDFYPVMKAVEAYFNQQKDLEFHIYSSRTASFKIGPVFIVLDHGASDVYQAKVPKGDKARQSYVQSLLLSNPEDLIGVKQKLFICGDQHSFQQVEYNDFEFFMFGCLPLADKFADHLNLSSRPRQNCMIINNDGLKEVWHYYIDSLVPAKAK